MSDRGDWHVIYDFPCPSFAMIMESYLCSGITIGLDNITWCFLYKLQKGDIIFHKGIDLAHMEEAVPQSPWHVRIYLCYHILGNLGCRLGYINRDPQAYIPAVVGRGHGDEGNIDVHAPSLHKQGDLREEDGCIVRPAFLDGGTCVRADEQCLVAELFSILLIRI